MNKMKMLLAAALALALPVVAAATEVRVTVEQSVKSGLTATYTSSGLLTTNTYKVRNDGKVFLHFKKTGAGACTVTIVTPNTANGLAIADQTVTVPATTGDQFVGPLPPSLFNDSSSDVSFSISDTVGLSFAVIRL
ncbi:MAG: hypothetical protein PHS14_02890 [Elusimicrobia bacterium]|nr:hypothetical protein [Elusimicrobiota bacterium]